MTGRRPRGLLPAKATFLVTALVATLLAPGPGQPRADALTTGPLGQWISMEKSVYGANEVVAIDIGQIAHVTNCPKGVRDYWWPFADVYAIPTGTIERGVISDGASIPGIRKTVFAVSGGGIAGEILGFTGPAGSLRSGSWGVVIDECQSGEYDQDVDALFPHAFSVRIPTDVPLPSTAAIDAVKSRAREQQKLLEKGLTAYRGLLLAADFAAIIQAVKKGAGDLLAHLINKLVGGPGDVKPKSQFVWLAGKVFGDAKGAALATLLNALSHYLLIAEDPPDPDYFQLAPIRSGGHIAPEHPDALEEATARLGTAMGSSAALLERFLVSYERFQGAAAQGDGEWALLHARAIQETALLASANLHDIDTALEGFDEAIASDPRAFDDMLTVLEEFRAEVVADGFSGDQERSLLNAGLTLADLAEVRAILAAHDLTGSVAAAREAVSEMLAGNAEMRTALDDARTAFADVEAQLEADPVVVDEAPLVSAGGPYTGQPGSPIQFTAELQQSTWPVVSYAWDLDGDGAFDDAEGETVTHAYESPFSGFVGVQVTNDEGGVGVGYTPISVQPAGDGPQVLDHAPKPRSAEVLLGGSQELSVQVSDPATTTVEWTIDEDPLGTGQTLTYEPTEMDEVGIRMVKATISTSPPHLPRILEWAVRVDAPDADGDGWNANVDCDDQDPDVNPGAVDVLNGIDDDCDPSTPDGGEPPTLASNGGRSYAEGDLVALTSDPGSTPETATEVTWDHPEKDSATFTATVDWGDGTVGDATYDSQHVYGEHRYADEGLYIVAVCMAHEAGATGCTEFQATVSNADPILSILDLHAWTPEIYGSPNGMDWKVAPDGQSVVQRINGSPTLFVSNIPFGYGTAEVKMTVLTTGDDDYIGFGIGYQPGMNEDPAADWWLIDWKQGDQSFCSLGPKGIALSHVTGVPPECDFWSHENQVAEVGRATSLGDQGWEDQTEYTFRFEVEPDRLRVWVDDVLELDHEAAFGPGYLAFYNYSQSQVQYRGVVTSGVGTGEGQPTPIRAVFGDPGTADTHTASMTFGDGTPSELVTIEPDGTRFRLSTSHVYEQDGSYTLDACVHDDDGGSDCEPIPVSVRNLAPVVDAGPDRTVNETVQIEATFRDPGIRDTQTATVDWGDGGPIESVAIRDPYLGTGTVAADHTYAAAGIHTVEVCVTDDADDTGCDAFEVTVVPPAPPEVISEDTTGAEGVPHVHPFAFADPNPDDTHTATIDWGDGSPMEDADVANSLRGTGTAFPVHTYADNGTYQVTITFCDQEDLCDVAVATAEIANLPPDTQDVEAEADEFHPIVIDVLANDTDVPADLPLHIAEVSAASAGGTATTDGEVVFYDPPNDFDGTDVFTYVAEDKDGGTATATVVVDVIENVFVAEDDAAEAYEFRSSEINVLSNDMDVDAPLRILEVGTPAAGGTASTDGTVVFYEPPHGYDGTDDFTYLAANKYGKTTSATVTVTVIEKPLPVALDERYETDPYTALEGNVLDNDHDHAPWNSPLDLSLVQEPRSGAVALETDGAFVYTPDPATFRDEDKFVYEVCDEFGKCDYATAFIVEVNCGIGGLAVVDGTVAQGTLSEVIYNEVERRIAAFFPEYASLIHEINCGYIVPLEREANEHVGGPP